MASRRPRRAAWGTISREVVIDRAVQLVERDGYDRLSLRTLAASLEVSPMALYRHIDNKEDLLDEVVGRLLADRWEPEVDRADWRGWLTAAADLLRQFLVEQPAALHVYLRRPVTSPSAMERMTATLEVLSAWLGDAARARRAYAALQTYTLGFAALEAAREAAPPELGADVPAEARELAAYSSPAQFRAGLYYLLTGIEDADSAARAGSAARGEGGSG